MTKVTQQNNQELTLRAASKQDKQKLTVLHTQCSLASVDLPHEDNKHALSPHKDWQPTITEVFSSHLSLICLNNHL